MLRGKKRARRGHRGSGSSWIWRGLGAALALVFMAAGVQVFRYAARSAATRREEAQMREEIDRVDAEREAVPVRAQEPSPAPWETAKPADLKKMFAAPLKRNPDTVGALEAGSSIKTWVVQRSDNTYYLSHSFEGRKNTAGAVFLDACCGLYPVSRNLVVYGHNMADGTAFAKLRDYRHEDYLNTFPVIRFATRYEDAHYAVFAAFAFSADENSRDYFDTGCFDFETEEDFLIFADLARGRSALSVPVDVEAGDNLVTLVTCDESNGSGRFAVMARKLREGEKPEDFANPIDGAVRELNYEEETSFMSGPDVAEVQKALKSLNYFQGECDGIYGLQTADAVLSFQLDHGLAPDGIAGAETREKLLKAAKG